MDDLNIKLKNKIMRRVYAIWFLRSAYCKVVGLASLAFLTSFYISFFSVIKNAVSSSYSPDTVLSYMFSSFVAADIVSKTLVVFMVVAVFMLGRDIFKRRTITGSQLARI